MRLFFALTLMTLSLSGFSASAQEAATSGDLEHNMKQIGDIFKAVGGSLKDPAKNAENAAAAAKISALFTLTKAQTPSHFSDIPEARRGEAMKAYQDMIQQCIDLSDQLQQAFLANDNALANEIYRKMKDLKQDGHDQFDP